MTTRDVIPELVGRVAGGYNHYDLTRWVVGGREYVRKRFPESAERRFRTEQAAYQLLNDLGCASVPRAAEPPSSLAASRQLWISWVEGGDGDGCGDANAWIRAAATSVREVHSATLDATHDGYGSLLAAQRRATPGEYWLSHVQDLDEAVERHALPRSWVDQFVLAVDAGLAQPDGATRCLAHRDLRSDNMIMNSAGRLMLIDWEIAAFVHPAFDLARLLLDPVFDTAAARELLAECYGTRFSDDVTRLSEAALGIQLIAYAPAFDTTSELFQQGRRLLSGAL